ncbi:Arginine deiminase [bioreactor metagenome]|jgi:arginine deiminase|uniref:Arginine deiminase n=1 Tax=bioreactor metagenome TaxID=1076179 RepID=A0A644VU37_9ZZZZ|nr:arginine deiminase [Bacteroidales bacterium]MBP8677731.1 arginine deiminase [Bacteroidales bacterium]MBP9584132.1 arginine deiminase [Bacteroidales bacterium]MBP9977786.1 arginine deiminase [Bacteroidales bacterium]WRQ32468.1 arginine deiminase family protein [Bacteroidales bacterium MB20-C3-3]
MASAPLTIEVQSEIGKLDAVLLHSPGAEVENMTPRNAQRALYSDILNLSIAQKEYEQVSGVLNKVAKTYQIRDLLIKILDNHAEREALIGKICVTENVTDYFEYLMDMSSKNLAAVLIEGLPAKINTLTAYLKDDYYALLPLYNFYFTRDASVSIGNRALICKMASKVRMRESLITEAIFRNPQFFDCNLLNAHDFQPGNDEIFMEGGDILIAREDILIIGNGMRTSSLGIDQLINRLCRSTSQDKWHVIVQQLPDSPESFIHLDMVFTFLDVDKAMVFEPLILNDNQYQTVHMTIEGGRVTKIKTVNNILSVLKKLGMELEPVICGGNADEWNQEREQWHSGANFFAFAPGKVMSYARNIHTLNELSKMDFEIIPAWDIVNGKRDLSKTGQCVVTIDGSELPRGGGGARCMTMPLRRQSVNWPK